MSDNHQLIGEKSTLRDSTPLLPGSVEFNDNKAEGDLQKSNADNQFDEIPSRFDDMDAAALCQWAYDHYDGKIEYDIPINIYNIDHTIPKTYPGGAKGGLINSL